MKHKLFYVFLTIISFTLMNNCQSDDNDENSNSGMKPKKYKVVESDGNSWKLNFQYNGNLITKVTTDFGNTITFSYDNGKLKNYKVEYDGEEPETYNVVYENDLLKQISNSTNSEKYIFEYNSNKQVSKSKYYENNNLLETESYEYDNYGNIIETKLGSTSFQTSFDSSNNPFRYVFPQMDAENTYEWFGGLVNNETISKVKHSTSSNYTTQYTYSYEYNSENYPTKRTQKSPNGSVQEVVTYEYY